MAQSIYSFAESVSANPQNFKEVQFQNGQAINRVNNERALFHISMVVKQTAIVAMSEYIYCSFPLELENGRPHEYLTRLTKLENLDGTLPKNMPVAKFGDDGKLYFGLRELMDSQEVKVTVTKLL